MLQQRRVALNAGCDSIQLEPWRRIPPPPLSATVRQVISEQVSARSAQTAALCADPPRSMAPTRAERAAADSLREQLNVFSQYVEQLREPLRDVYFDFGSARIRTGPDTDAIQTAAEALRERPDLDLVLTGYTDEAGLSERNFRLAKARADAVRALPLQRRRRRYG